MVGKFWVSQAASDVELVKVGSARIPSKFSARIFEQDNGDPDVEFVFEVRDGRPECRAVHIEAREDGHEVRVSGLAGLRVQDVLEDAVKRLILGPPTIEDGRVNWPRAFPTKKQQDDAVKNVQAARRNLTITNHLLREVADIYRENVRSNPTKAVAEHFAKSDRMAGLYVKAARDRTDPKTGKRFLGAAIKGKAGER